MQHHDEIHPLQDSGTCYTKPILQDMRASDIRKLASELGASNWEGSRRLSKAELVTEILWLTNDRRAKRPHDDCANMTLSPMSPSSMPHDLIRATDVGCGPSEEQSSTDAQLSANQRFRRDELEMKSVLELRSMTGNRRKTTTKENMIRSLLRQCVLHFSAATVHLDKQPEALLTTPAWTADAPASCRRSNQCEHQRHGFPRKYMALARRICKQKRINARRERRADGIDKPLVQ
jgi:hypothetical protein